MYPIIVDNLLPAGYANDLEKDIMDRGFPWHFVKDVTYNGYGSNGGFAHVIYNLGEEPSPYMAFFKPIVYSIEQVYGGKIEKILRIRIGLLLPDSRMETPYDPPHVDFFLPHYTACDYVTDSDGDTVVFDQTANDLGSEFNEDILYSFTESATFTEQTRCTPVKNRLLLFDGFNFHSSTRPKIADRRIVITVNFI